MLAAQSSAQVARGPQLSSRSMGSGRAVLLSRSAALQVRQRASRGVAVRAQAANKPVVNAATMEPPSQAKTDSPVQKAKTAVVVGGGVGGLVVAGRLARSGFKVTLLEKNKEVGGRMQSYNPPEAPEYRFDTGPSLLLLPDVYKQTFKELGTSLEEHVDIKLVEPAAYRAHFGDHTSFDMVYDMVRFREQVEKFEPGAGGKFIEWLGKARVSLDLGVKAFIEQDSDNVLDFIDPRRVLGLAWKVGVVELLGSQYWQISKFFKTDKMRALFSFQDLYVGLSPYSAPGIFSLLAATEITDGVWYPVGGFQKVRDAIENIVTNFGVQIRKETAVEQILLEQPEAAASSGGGAAARPRAVGVRLASGEVVNADVVVANPDLPQVYNYMLEAGGEPIKKEAARLDTLNYSASVIAFNWAIKGKLNLLHHNVFLSSDYKGSWDRPTFPEDFDAPKQHNFYVHNPTYTDKSCAPEGCDSVMVLLPVANLLEQEQRAKKAGRPPPSLEELVAAGRKAVLRRFVEGGVCGEDIESRIQHEFVIAPPEWRERYNIRHGSVFGLSHDFLQLACFRPPTQTQIPGFPDTPKIDGLYFVGASTRPGNGVPLVMMGAKVTYDNIMKDTAAAKEASL